MKKIISLLSVIFINAVLIAQSTTYKINKESYDNSKNSYNYTNWNDNYKTITASDLRFNNYTEKYLMSVNYETISFHSLSINETNLSPADAYLKKDSELFANPKSGNISYAILKNGAVIHKKPTTRMGLTDKGASYTQLPEFGTWCNRRMIDHLGFTNNAPTKDNFTGIEFTNWHDRFKVTFHVRPTVTITNGQLQLAIEMPDEYSNKLNNGTMYSFADSSNKGFALKAGTTVGSVNVSGNTITIKTNQTNLVANNSYKLSLIFYPIDSNIENKYKTADAEEGEVTVTAAQSAPDSQSIAVNYDSDEGIYYLETPRYAQGYNNCTKSNVLQNVDMKLANTTSIDKKVRLCFQQFNSSSHIGFTGMLRNNNGDPSGHILQISKNWHGNSAVQQFGGNQLQEYTEIIVPAQSTIIFDYTKVGAKWGETYAASSHQLSLVGIEGWDSMGWLQASLGGFGENICHSPDYLYGMANGTDWRPFLTTNSYYGGSSNRCGWTGNVGGIDFSNYFNSSGRKSYQSEVKTNFDKYGPNLTETSVSFYSADRKIRTTYTYFLNRSDDFMRTYYKVKIEALQTASFNRYDFFQLGSDQYAKNLTHDVAYGNSEGLTGKFDATHTNVLSSYTTDPIPLTGKNPWVWAGDGEPFRQNYANKETRANTAFIIRDYKATFGGVRKNTPYFRERPSTGAGSGNNPVSYCLVPPPDVNNLAAGDVVEFTIEAMIFPRRAGDYYGPNTNFKNALALNENSWEILYREAVKNEINATSTTNNISTDYPLTVETIGNSGMVTITGGAGYIPLVFSGLTNITNPILYKSVDGSTWETVNQSFHGKDFWQIYNNPKTGLFDLIYNVNQDITDDETATISYRLGNNIAVTELSIVLQSKLGDNPYTTDDVLEPEDDDLIILAPQIKENGITGTGVENKWSWTGPNDFSQSGRVIRINNVSAADAGTYTVKYTTNGVTTTDTFKINLENITSNNTAYYINNVATNNRIKSNSGGTDIEPAQRPTDLGWLGKWELIDAGNGYYYIENVANSMRLHANGSSGSEGVKIVADTFDGDWVQWKLTKIGNNYYIDNKAHNIRLYNTADEITAGSTNWTGTWAQWTLTNSLVEELKGSKYYVDNVGANRRLKTNASNTDVIDANTSDSGWRGLWEFTDTGDGYFYIENVANNMKLKGTGQSGEAGVKIVDNTNTGDWVKWELSKIGNYYYIDNKAHSSRLSSGTNEISVGTTNWKGTWSQWRLTDNSNKVSSLNDTSEVVIYPNPVSNILTIDFYGSKDAEARVINTAGQIVFKSAIKSGNNTLNFNTLESGIYFVKIVNEQQVLVEKVIKE
ncbi:hypothetical protein GCM10022393_09620 [Aquimarina addita]|uniref:T9SS C-terminal target domain-containing protein n=1 Tax=Aquimarina addita TaxID=870485 RepID=A0ABP7XCQ2_9FLAO